MLWKNVYLINLGKRNDRLEKCSKMLNTQHINFNRFSAIAPDLSKIKDDILWNRSSRNFCRRDRRRRKDKYTIGALGCKMSHYYVIKKAKENNLDYVIILEDDIIFNQNYLDNKKDIDDNILKLINEQHQWDVIYIGGNCLRGKYKQNRNKYSFRSYEEEEIDKLSVINKYCIKVDAVNTTLGYIVNKSMFDQLLNKIPNSGLEIDTFYNQNLLNNKVYKINPEIFYQNFNDSDICNKI
jgi:GR25 family glycosyltransferase involved in LPS biosynthesis